MSASLLNGATSNEEISHEGLVSHRSAVRSHDLCNDSNLTAGDAARCRAERRSSASCHVSACPCDVASGRKTRASARAAGCPSRLLILFRTPTSQNYKTKNPGSTSTRVFVRTRINRGRGRAVSGRLRAGRCRGSGPGMPLTPPATAPYGRSFVPPCLPTKAPQPPTGEAWLHEIKMTVKRGHLSGIFT
jgi:hypothetical protein